MGKCWHILVFVAFSPYPRMKKQDKIQTPTFPCILHDAI